MPLAVLHLVVLLVVGFPAPRCGMAALPFIAADSYAILGLVIGVERRFWALGGSGSGPNAR